MRAIPKKAIDWSLKQRNVKVNVVMEFDNIETIKQAIAIGAGVSTLPRPTVSKEIGIGSLAAVPLDMPGLVRPVGIIHRKQSACRRPSPASSNPSARPKKASASNTNALNKRLLRKGGTPRLS
jgi:DNA-binding transcriptional LysR family regulator